MTVIVGWFDKKSAWIGGDSGAFSDDTVTIATDPKVWKAEDSLIGIAGSFRQGELARESGIGDPYALRDHLATIWEGRNNTPSDWGAELLVVNLSGIYYITDDFAVVKCRETYGSVGGGEAIALGALFALDGITIAPKERLTIALKAASNHGAMSRPPFKILEL